MRYAVVYSSKTGNTKRLAEAVRAALGMQATREEGTAATNRYLKIGRHL